MHVPVAVPGILPRAAPDARLLAGQMRAMVDPGRFFISAKTACIEEAATRTGCYCLAGRFFSISCERPAANPSR